MKEERPSEPTGGIYKYEFGIFPLGFACGSRVASVDPTESAVPHPPGFVAALIESRRAMIEKAEDDILEAKKAEHDSQTNDLLQP